MGRKPLDRIAQKVLKFGEHKNAQVSQSTYQKVDEDFPTVNRIVIKDFILNGRNQQIGPPIGFPSLNIKGVRLKGGQMAGRNSCANDLLRDREKLLPSKGAIRNDVERGLGTGHQLFVPKEAVGHMSDKGLGVKHEFAFHDPVIDGDGIHDGAEGDGISHCEGQSVYAANPESMDKATQCPPYPHLDE
jgi:hypothetical protein